MKTPAAKLPQESQIHAHLYNSCDDYVQTSLVNTAADFFTLSEDQLLTTLETIVTQHSNPAVHHLKFTSLTQSENESIENFVVTLKSVVPDCEFTFPTATTTCKTLILKINLLKGSIMAPSKQISLPRPIIPKLLTILSNMPKLSHLLYMINHLYITHPIPISQKCHLTNANNNTTNNRTKV